MSATAVLYGIKAAAGVAQGVFGYQQMQQAAARERALRGQGIPEMQTSQEYFDLYQNASRSRQFEAEKAATQSILASNLATLQQAGSRAVIGGSAAAQTVAQRGLASAANADFNRQQQALGQLAAAQQQTAAYNFQAQSNQYARDLLTAQAGYQAGAETMLGGFTDAVAGGVGMAGAMDKSASVDEELLKEARDQASQIESPTSKRSAPGIVTPESPFGQEVVGLEGGGSDFGGGFGVNPTAPNVESPVVMADPASSFPTGNVPQGGIVVPAGGYSTQQEAAFKNPGVQIARGSDGFYYPQYAKGGSVTTPGKYTADHSVEYDVKTKSGKTIATVTGDETLVFNPEQRRFLKKVIGKLMKGQTMKPSKADTKAANQTLKAFKK